MQVYLFYSINCQHSVRLIEKMKKSKARGVVTDFICVDKKNGVRPKEVTDYNISEIPTILIPELASKLQGTAAFEWFAEEDKKMNKKPEIGGIDMYETGMLGIPLDSDTRIAGDDDYIQQDPISNNTQFEDYADILSREKM